MSNKIGKCLKTDLKGHTFCKFMIHEDFVLLNSQKENVK